ncbi:MAG: fumarate reductase subunit D [Gammaproteobacteria bacterium]|nr:fumarate reductase subunit D [Gammaproteobacteria bacterium]
MNSKTPLKASNKPIIWSLFAAGGTVTALLFPVLILLFALAVPFGLLPAELFTYDRIQGMLDNTFIKLIIFALLFLSIWHAAHRMRITAHDFGIRADGFIAFLFYAIAAVATVILLVALL